MGKVSVDLPDAEREVIARLVALGRTAQTGFPSATLAAGATVVQVSAEPSDLSDYPVMERVPMQITCHADPNARTAVKELAGDVLNDLCSWAGNANVSGVFGLSGRSDVSEDPDTRNLMCWVRVRVDLKATLNP